MVRPSRRGRCRALLTSETTTGVVDGDDIDWTGGGYTGGTGAPGADGADGTDLGWFDVTDPDYGATGDGTTDDTAAINLAIAALNTATKGVLYFPAGEYLVSAGLTAITAACTILGDGRYGPSKIVCTSTTAVLFTLSADGCAIRSIWLHNSSTTSAGAAIVTTGGLLAEFHSVTTTGFYTGIDIENALAWTVHACHISDFRKYGIRIRNTASPDAGDWAISDSWFGSTHTADAAIRQESAGGGKITNVKINGSTSQPITGIDLAIGSGSDTSILLIANCSIENVSGDAIRATTTGTGLFYALHVVGTQVGLFSNNSGRAVKVTAASAGGLVAGGIAAVIIDGCTFRTDGTARAAVELTNTDKAVLGEIALLGFNARYTSTGDTNTTDGGGAPTGADYLVGTAQAGLSAEIVVGTTPGGELGGTWASPTVDATHSGSAHTDFIAKAIVDAKGDLIAATAADTVARVAVGTDGQYLKADSGATAGVSWVTPSSGGGELLISDTPSTPLVFADLLQNEAQDDLLYADP